MAYNYTPITLGVRSYPDWWKALPNPKHVDVDTPSIKNMKRCFGFTELFKRSFVLNSWCDMHFRVTPDDGYRYYVSGGDVPSEHNKEQYDGSFNGYYHTKLVSPWYIVEKDAVPCGFIAADYHHDQYNFKIVPGINQYKDNSSTNVNIMLPKLKQTYDFFIPIGMPLVHIIPLVEDKKIEVKNHLVTIDELDKIRRTPNIFTGFHSLLNLRKKQEEQTKSKCPFHFG
jgi:hypothetical protein